MADDYEMTTHGMHLAEDLGIRVVGLDDAFWADRERVELASGRLLSQFSYNETWDFQERHPTGDELAYVLRGDVDLLLDDGRGERPQRLVAGRAGVIPAGSWHRIAIREPATLLFITPVPASTEHRAFRAG